MTLTAAEAPWYIAQLRPNGLQMATRGLLRQGFEMFLPKVPNNSPKTRRTGPEWVPLFPGYVFVRFDPARPAWRTINSTRGVSRLVGFGPEGPSPVPFRLVDALQARCDAEGIVRPPDNLKAGDAVRLLTGPFADFVTTVEKISADRRIYVLLDLMGRATRISVAVEDLCRA
ncbi:MAG: transcriptional activator RfaH [Allgaiera sp.]|nr:transcriptional activator RfaH [Allgaiera sp.]